MNQQVWLSSGASCSSGASAAQLSIGSEEQAYGDRLVRDPVQCSDAPTSTQRQKRSIALICALKYVCCCGDVLGDVQATEQRLQVVLEEHEREELQPALRVPWELQPALQVPWELQPAMQVPWELQPALRVPWELQPALRVLRVVQPALQVLRVVQPAMRVPWVVQPALQVPWELQPAMRVPWELQPALRVPWELQPALRVLRVVQPALLVLRRYANALTTKLAFVAEPSPALPSLNQPLGYGVDPEPSPCKCQSPSMHAVNATQHK
ncbi:hypothetical protein QJQ45_011047 [Haematococcus lacustris]|nr:hypothetical protein QJQ45_011047 [Haematococcus lacustris]